jgi:hypothetical protein
MQYLKQMIEQAYLRWGGLGWLMTSFILLCTVSNWLTKWDGIQFVPWNDCALFMPSQYSTYSLYQSIVSNPPHPYRSCQQQEQQCWKRKYSRLLIKAAMCMSFGFKASPNASISKKSSWLGVTHSISTPLSLLRMWSSSETTYRIDWSEKDSDDEWYGVLATSDYVNDIVLPIHVIPFFGSHRERWCFCQKWSMQRISAEDSTPSWS